MTFLIISLNSAVNYPPVPTSEYVSVAEKPKDNLGFDAVSV